MGRLGLITLLLVFICSLNALAGDSGLESVSRTEENCYTCSYDQVEHDYILDLPEDPKGAPLILMLHGYGETAESFRRETGFYEEAVRKGYIVVHATGAPNPEDRTSASGWNYDDYDGKNDDVGFLKALAGYISEEYSADSTRWFVVGYSNGGFMSHRIAIDAADAFAAAVCVSGTMPEQVWERRPDVCRIGFFQITGQADNTIPKKSDGSAQYAKSPAIEDVMDYYVTANDLDRTEEAAAGKASVLARFCGENADRQVWHLIIGEGHHSWSAESVTGINTNQMILDFLENQ